MQQLLTIADTLEQLPTEQMKAYLRNAGTIRCRATVEGEYKYSVITLNHDGQTFRIYTRTAQAELFAGGGQLSTKD